MRSNDAARRLRRPALVIALVVATLLGLGAPASAATFASPNGGTRQVIGAVLERYTALGGPAGFLGGPLTDELPTPNGVGRFNAFAGGSIYWTGATGAHEVHGSIRDRWAALGWENSFLGFPASDELSTPDRPGRFSLFQGGSVYWSAATGAHVVRGGIRDRWAALGWENSRLGFPTTDELITPNGVGTYNVFQGGSVYWSPATGAHAVSGPIRDEWAALGWENSALGFPAGEERAVTGGRAQDFQRGTITWTAAGGAVAVSRLPLGATPPGSQLITVAAPSAGSTTATLTAWQRGANGWQAVLGPVPARIGSAGVGAASETTTRTPAGQFRLTEAFGRAANPGTALPYRVLDRSDWWVSDTRSPLYNQHTRCAPGTCPFNEAAGENLYAAGAVYDNAVVIDYNRSPAVPGAGSAFFLHITNGAPTAGCVAVDRAALQQVLRWLDPRATPVIALGVG